VNQVGAIWTEMTPAEHDASVALTSHVPQILASWLAASASEDTWTAAGPAFSDMTRIAGGSEDMWKDIFSTNGPAIGAVASAIATDLEAIAHQLQLSHPRLELVLELLAKARRQSTKPGES
jgi:prephenate dehydrogenase